MARKKQSAARPRLACEISTRGVIAARAGRKSSSLEISTTRRLAEGVVAPALTGTNVRDGAALRAALADALGGVSGGSRDVIAVLPDAAIRVLLLDFESLPSNPRESEAIIRFRLKKSLPFDVDQAALSWEVRGHSGGAGVHMVAAVAPRDVVNEYESAFRDAGYAPGVVLPSSLASLGLVKGERPTLLLRVDPLNITVAAVERQELRLMRTLDIPDGANAAAELAEAVLPSIMFFEDTFGARIEHILITGLQEMEEIGPLLHEHTGARVEELAGELASGADLGGGFPRSAMAGVAGALLG